MHLKTRFLNQSGMTMVELLVAGTIGLILFGLSITIFINQKDLMEDERESVNIRALGRHAINKLVDDLRLAGYGINPNSAITAAQNTSITYLANTDDVSSLLSSDGSSGSNTVTVRNATGFSNTQKVIVYSTLDTATAASLRTLNNVVSSTLTLSSNLGQTYTTANLAIINRYHTIQYSYDSGTQIISKTVDAGTAIPIVGNVTSFDLNFWDAAGNDLGSPVASGSLDDIRKIEISLTLQDASNTSATVSFNTDVNLRNMSS